MIDETRVRKYCSEDISLIENYEQAINDDTQVWHCHHRLETPHYRPGDGKTGFDIKRQVLIELDMYYKRPAEELIFLTPFEHKSLHNKGEKHPFFGQTHSEETKRKMSEAHKGENLSEETRKKISDALTGKILSEETKRKMSEAKTGENNPFFCQHHSEEARKKISEAKTGENNPMFGKRWYNNGILCKRFFPDQVPEGFIRGRLRKKKSNL